MVLAVAHPNPWASASSYISLRSGLADSRNLHATSRSSHSRRVLSPVASSSVASPSSASFRDGAAACRSLALAASPAFRRNSALLAAVFWPLEFIELSSRKDDSSDAHCDHLPPSHIVAQFHSLRRTLVPPQMTLALGSPSGAS